MNPLVRFLAAHPRLVSAAFICGVLLLVVRVIDERMSSNSKVRFDDWIKRSAKQLVLWDLNHIFLWVKRNAVYYYAGYVAFLALAVKLICMSRGEPMEWGIPKIIAFASLFPFAYFIAHDDLREAVFKVLRFGALFTIGIQLLICFLAGLKAPLNGSFPYTWPEVRDVLIGVPSFVALIGGLYLIPALLLFLIRPLVAIGAKGVWWLSTYPKGPWAGLVFILTIGLGIWRLFL